MPKGKFISKPHTQNNTLDYIYCNIKGTNVIILFKTLNIQACITITEKNIYIQNLFQ